MMARVEIPSCPGELPDAEYPTTPPERRQNLGIPRSPNKTNGSPVVKIDSILDRLSFKGKHPIAVPSRLVYQRDRGLDS